jgi:hypothetical protein
MLPQFAIAELVKVFKVQRQSPAAEIPPTALVSRLRDTKAVDRMTQQR